jgi:hypothetical protein
MTEYSMPTSVNDQSGSSNSERAPRPTEKSQAGFPENLAQQAQTGPSEQRSSAGWKPLFRR